jgi:predicted nucleotidyltransferase
MDYLKVLKLLLERKVKFAVAGGFALIAHGVIRVTMDLDLIVTMDSKELEKAWDTLASIGFLPRQPLKKEQVTDLDSLKKISKEKNMIAFSFYHQEDNFVVVDLLIGDEFSLSDKNIEMLVLFGTKCPVITRDKLIELKQNAGREKDLEDIRALKKRVD